MSRKKMASLSKGVEMRNSKLLMELESLAEKLDVQVTYEKLFPSRSGLCRLHNKYMLFVESKLREDERVQVFVTALSNFSLDNLQVLPRIRQLLEANHPEKPNLN
jgi:hypothetical protein